MTVLITGGTGTLGTALREQLESAGQQARVLSRRPRPETEPDDAWATGDLKSGISLDDALCGVSTIIHCATDGRSDLECTRNLISAARKAGVAHLVYISIVGVDRHPLFYYRTKFRVERLVESSGLPWTILRATQFHNLLLGLFHSQRWLPVLFAPACSFQTIDVHEVAARLAQVAAAEPVGRVDDIGGPEVVTAKALAGAYLASSRSKRQVVTFRLPGKTFAAYAAGYHLAPASRYGRITFTDFLARRTAARRTER